MYQPTTIKQRLSVKAFTLLTATAMILSALPVSFFNFNFAEAAGSSITMEVFVNPIGNDANFEYISITNNGPDSLDLDGLKLDEGGVQLALAGSVNNGDTLRVCANDDNAANGNLNCAFKFPVGFNLVNSGGSVQLRDATDVVVLSAAWGVTNESAAATDTQTGTYPLPPVIPPACTAQIEEGRTYGPVQNTNTTQFFSTIKNALDDCDTADGHTIVVQSGTYDAFRVTNNAPENLTIKAAVGTSPVIQSDINKTGSQRIVDIQANGTTLDGFVIRNVNDGSAAVVGITLVSGNNTIINNTVENTTTALQTSNTPNAINNVIKDNVIDSVTLPATTGFSLQSANNTITRNTISVTRRGVSTLASGNVVKFNDFSVIGENETGASQAKTNGGATLDVENNWWGVDTGIVTVEGDNIDSDPWLCGPFATSPDESVGGACVGDIVKPVIVVDSPADGVVVGSDFDITVTATEDVALNRVILNLRNTTGGHMAPCLNVSAGGAASFTVSCTVDVDALAEGTYSFKTNTSDLAGNTSQTLTQTFIVDKTGPVIVVNNPADNLMTGAGFDIGVTATDAYGIGKVVINIKDALGAHLGTCLNEIADGSTSYTTSCTISLTDWADGTYQFKTNALDIAGNISNTITQTYTINTNRPTIVVNSPTDVLTTDEDFDISVTATDDTGIARVVINIKDESGAHLGTCLNEVADGSTPYSTSCTIDVDSLAEGIYHFRTNARDTTGNLSNTINQKFIVAGASLEILTPTVDEEVYSIYEFTAEYDDNDQTKDAINWAVRAGSCSANTVAGNVDGFSDSSTFVGDIFSTTLDTGLWANGEYCLVVNPSEQSGEVDLRATQMFTVMNNLVCEAGVNLVSNPSFEMDLVIATRGWDLFDSISNWVVEKFGGGNAEAELHAGVNGWTSADGDQHATLGSTQHTQWSQTILTKPGEEYTLSWQYSPRPGEDKPENRTEVSIDGQLIREINLRGESAVAWETYTHTFVATSSSVTVMFADTGTNNGRAAFIDDVSLSCNPFVPEPEMITVTGTKFDEAGVGLLGWEIVAFNSELEETATTSTGADGSYSLTVKDSGSWVVSEVMQPNWTQIKAVENGTDIFPSVESAARCEFGDSQEFMSLLSEPLEIFSSTDDEGLVDNICDFHNRELGNGDSDAVSPTESRPVSTSGGSFTFPAAARSAQPQVLGAATSNFCPYINDHMQFGSDNDSWEVTKLQAFLTTVMGYDNPINGIFDAITELNVKKFQATYAEEILMPWFNAGIVPHDRPTGFVYKTTTWKINDLVCPGTTAFPSLAGEDLSSNVSNNPL